MKPRLMRVGAGAHPVMVADAFGGDLAEVVDTAAALAPFPPASGTYYPGLRRVITPGDARAMTYVQRTLRQAAPLIGGAFDCDGFDLIEASFSLVTFAPEALAPPQRGAHFDSVDPDYVAVMHYLSPTAGTAFYRQRSTGIEQVTAGNVAQFVGRAQAEAPGLSGYLGASNAVFERIGLVEGVADRLVAYRGGLLHSGLIDEDAALSPDPRLGRLTANFFIRTRTSNGARRPAPRA